MMTRTKRKSMMEILETMRNHLLAVENGPIYKSDLKARGIDPRTAENYFRIILFCQYEMPRLSISESKGRFLVMIEQQKRSGNGCSGVAQGDSGHSSTNIYTL